jgi:hypothetical protein
MRLPMSLAVSVDVDVNVGVGVSPAASPAITMADSGSDRRHHGYDQAQT